jgi:FkbM family methyltransferase
MSLHAVRMYVIKKLIDLNEKIFFERDLLKFYRNEFKTPCATVIDVGANKGQSIEFFLKLNPECRILALEPNPTLYNLLVRKYASHRNIKIFNLGVSNHSGEKLFFENVFDYTSSFEDLNPQSVYLRRKAKILGVKPENIVSNQYPVNVTTLKEFISTNLPDTGIDVLKIDTEGHEYYCLEGLFTGNDPVNLKYIQIENHNDDMYKNRVPYERIKDLLGKNNFTEHKVIPHGYSNLDEVVYKRI